MGIPSPVPATVAPDKAFVLHYRSEHRPVKRTPQHGRDIALFEDGQGWLNLYETERGAAHSGGIYRTPEAADDVAKPWRKCRAFIQWDPS